MAEHVLPFGNQETASDSGLGLDLSQLGSVRTVDKKTSHLSEARANEVLEGFFQNCNVHGRQDRLQLLATLVRYLWENGTSPRAKYKKEKWGNVVESLDNLIPLNATESMRQFGRSVPMNTAAYYLAQGHENKKWILAYAKSKQKYVSEESAAIAFDFYDKSTYPVSFEDNNREVARSAETALRRSNNGQTERAEGSQAMIIRDDEHTF